VAVTVHHINGGSRGAVPTRDTFTGALIIAFAGAAIPSRTTLIAFVVHNVSGSSRGAVLTSDALTGALVIDFAGAAMPTRSTLVAFVVHNASGGSRRTVLTSDALTGALVIDFAGAAMPTCDAWRDGRSAGAKTARWAQLGRRGSYRAVITHNVAGRDGCSVGTEITR
jgi:hypothetical protein